MKIGTEEIVILGISAAAVYMIFKAGGISLPGFSKAATVAPRRVGNTPSDYGILRPNQSLADYWIEQAQIYGTDSVNY